MLMAAVILENAADHLAGRDLALDRVEEMDEFRRRLRCTPRPMTLRSSGSRAVNSVVVPLSAQVLWRD
jgi:hypothetical protein